MIYSKIINRDLNLRLIKKRTLQSIFKILINESIIKSKELDLHNRFIFDFFYKPNFYNSKISFVSLKDRFYSLNVFRYSRFIYFFFNVNLFFYLQHSENSSKIIHAYLFNRKKFVSIFFNKVNFYNFKCVSLWGFNLSLNNFFSFLEDILFLEKQIKDYLHEEGKKIFIKKVFLSKTFFIKIFRRRYHLSFFKDSLFFLKNTKLVNKKIGFNVLYFFGSFLFIYYLYLFFLCYLFSIFYIIDLFLNKIKNN